MIGILILAYGNPLRSDDGVAWRAAEELKLNLSAPEIEIVCAQQLAPEMAEKLSWVDAVIFVDAAEQGQPGEVRCNALVEPLAGVRFSHQLSPTAIVALAKQLYGASPQAYCVTLTGECFDDGDSLSAVAEGALPRFIAKVEALVDQITKSQPVSFVSSET